MNVKTACLVPMFAMAFVAKAETVAFYQFNEEEPGTAVSTVLNAVDSSLHSGTAVSVAGGSAKYSIDAPGYWLYSDSFYTNLLSSFANSVAFAPAEGDTELKSGGLVTLADLATAISAMDEGTVEFYAKSDASQSWRNIVTFNAGQPFKICFYNNAIYWQNFHEYGNTLLYNLAYVPAASGIWLHIAVTWSKENNVASNYLNHVYQNSELLTNSVLAVSRPMYVGGSSTTKTGELINGKVFGLRVSNRALSPKEMVHATFFPMDDDDISVSLDGISSSHASVVTINEGGKLKIRDGVELSAGILFYAGKAVSSGVYTGIGGDLENAVAVEWIDGTGTLTVTGASAASIWRESTGGDWSEADNWLGGGLPSSSRCAYVNILTPSSYTVAISKPVEAPSSLEIQNGPFVSAVVDVQTGGSIDFSPGASVVVKESGVFQVSGGAVSATGTTFTVENGGVMRVTDGTFALTNTAHQSFIAKSGSAVEISGGEMRFHGASDIFSIHDGSRLDVSQDGRLVTSDALKHEFNLYSDAVFSDNANLRTHHLYIGPSKSANSSVVTFKDSASMTFVSDAVLYVGSSKCAGNAVLNLDSKSTTSVPYGVIVGAKKYATLNIRNGHHLIGRGNLNAVGYRAHNAFYGEVNVYDGAFVQRSAAQWTDCLYGISIGEGKGFSDYKVEGILNVYPDGVVSNISSGVQKGAGVYLKVGCGSYAHGIINQLGGSLYHDSNLQCVIGIFGGVGEWNIRSGSVATVNADVYIGGAITNELVGFNGVAEPGSSPWNGGEKFAAKYDAFAPGKGTLSVENGLFCTPSNIFTSVVGEGIISVGPEGGRIEAKNVTFSNYVCEVEGVQSVSNSTLCVRFGSGTAGTVAASEKLTVTGGTRLVLDFTDYEKTGTSWFPVASYSEREGYFADDDIEIVGDSPGGVLVKDITHKGVKGIWYYVPNGTHIFLR